MKSINIPHSLRLTWSKLFFVSLIAAGWIIMIADPAQLMSHHSPNMGWMPVDFFKALAMWMIMVLAMMVPTLIPLFRSKESQPLGSSRIIRFVVGFIFAWAGFCLAATALQYVMRSMNLLNMHDASVSRWLSASLLIGAGLYQLSTAKRTHLAACQLSLKRLKEAPPLHGRLTIRGLAYGIDCVKCCWPMMLTMFVFGLMNIVAMAALTILMIAEKMVANTNLFSKITGALFIAAGIFVLAF